MDAILHRNNDLYAPVISTITRIEELTATEKRFEISLPGTKVLNHKPGQFVEVSIFGFGEAPISICSSPTQIPNFELTVRKTGRLTDRMHLMREGETLGIRGPFGNGFEVSHLYGKDMLFIAGGIGLAPLKSLIDYTIAERSKFGRIIILYGTKSPSEILFKNEIGLWQQMKDVEFHMTVDRPDNSWRGKAGVITR